LFNLQVTEAATATRAAGTKQQRPQQVVVVATATTDNGRRQHRHLAASSMVAGSSKDGFGVGVLRQPAVFCSTLQTFSLNSKHSHSQYINTSKRYSLTV